MNHSLQYLLDLTLVLTRKEIQIRYKNSILGYLWSILQPLSFALVYFFAFKIVMRFKMENYTLFLITGMFPWQWFANSINQASSTFVNNASIIKKVDFPRNALVIANILNDGLHFVLSIPVIILFFFIYDTPISISWLYGIPILLILQAAFTYGLSLLIATINIFFRDMKRLVSILVRFLFFLTPIIYNYDMIPEKYRYLLVFNPLAPLMIGWRNLFLTGQLEVQTLLFTFVYATIAISVGSIIYNRLVWKFSEVI